jgi:hypothetical protein
VRPATDCHANVQSTERGCAVRVNFVQSQCAASCRPSGLGLFCGAELNRASRVAIGGPVF